MRLIDADAIRYDQLLKIGNKKHPLEWAVSRPLINSMPTIEAEPVKHGRWEVSYAEYGVVVHRCSLCGHTIATHEDSNYCPNCGADMRGGE